MSATDMSYSATTPTRATVPSVPGTGTRLRAEGYALFSCIRVIRSPEPLDNERSWAHRETGQAASHGFEKSVRIWSIGVKDNLSATKLVPVVLTTQRRSGFEHPVFRAKPPLALRRSRTHHPRAAGA